MFSPRKKGSKNRDYCVVKGCGKKSTDDVSLRFHKFPKENKKLVEVKNYFGKVEQVDQFLA